MAKEEKKSNEEPREKLPDNLVIVGKKDTKEYAYPILLRLETQKQIKLSSNLCYAPKAERLISLFKILGVEEMRRSKVGEKRIEYLLAR